MAQYEIDEAKMEACLEAKTMAEQQSFERIVLDLSKTDEGLEFHVIRDETPGIVTVLWKMPKDIARGTPAIAEKKLTYLRERQVVLAILAAASL